jgi:hypothetical protein
MKVLLRWEYSIPRKSFQSHLIGQNVRKLTWEKISAILRKARSVTKEVSCRPRICFEATVANISFRALKIQLRPIEKGSANGKP